MLSTMEILQATEASLVDEQVPYRFLWHSQCTAGHVMRAAARRPVAEAEVYKARPEGALADAMTRIARAGLMLGLHGPNAAVWARDVEAELETGDLVGAVSDVSLLRALPADSDRAIRAASLELVRVAIGELAEEVAQSAVEDLVELCGPDAKLVVGGV